MASVPGGGGGGGGRKTIPPFLVFSNEQRQNIKAINPSLCFAELQKQLASMWAQLSEDQKQDYKNRPVQPKNVGVDAPLPQVSSSPKKGEYEYKRIFPKLAPSPMTHYLATERAKATMEFPLMSRFELNDLLVKRWKNLSKEEKEVYEEHSATDMARWTVEWNQFLEKNPDFEDEDSDGGEYSPSDDESLDEEQEMEDDEDDDEDQRDSDESGDDDDCDMDSSR